MEDFLDEQSNMKNATLDDLVSQNESSGQNKMSSEKNATKELELADPKEAKKRFE